MNKDKEFLSEQEQVVAELFIKVVAMERILLKLKIFSEQSLHDEMKLVSNELLKIINDQISNVKSKEN